MAWLLVIALLAVGGAGLGSVLTQPNSLLASSSQLIVQDTSAAVVWSAGWKVESSRTALGGTIHYSSTAGASASLIYYGSYMKIIGPTGHGAGDLRVTVDGQTSVVSTHGAVFQARQVIFGAGPTGDRHVLTFQVVGSPGHPNVAIDAFVISAGQAATSNFKFRHKPTATPPAGTASAPSPGPGTSGADPTPTPDPTDAPTPTPTATPPSTPAPTPTPTQPPGPGGETAYGVGIGADSLANTQVGGTDCGCSNRTVSFRFLATTTSQLSSARIYLMSGSGYSGGTGGTLSVTVQTDDGTANHGPSGTILASASVRPGSPISIGYLPLISFPTPASLVAGQLYHLVFKDNDPNPTSNFVSVNALWTTTATTPRQQAMSDLDWGQLLNDGHGWTTERNFTPIVDLGYANGIHAGMGYMEVWINAPKTISGSSEVRETFTPSSGHTVSSVMVRVSQKSGSSPLSVKLETAGGSVMASGSISAAAIGTSPDWATTALSSTVTLSAGIGYLLVLSAPSDSAYSAFSIERGNNYQFSKSTYFSDGYGQYTTGSSWSGFDQPGGSSNNSNSDLQFYLQ